jgi:flagellar basal-body rod protein FlgB
MGAISFDNALGIHPQALTLRAHRAQVLANNLTNSETPNFKARDINFHEVLRNAKDKSLSVGVSRTDHQHLSLGQSGGGVDLMYRTQSQASVDGNSVDSQMEQVRYARNALEYNATFQFLNGKFRGLLSAIKGQ